MSEYAYKTYGMARFHVPEGMYSIEELEEILANMKEAKKHQDEHLKAAMTPLKEKNHER
jgi:FPC/CPF motif-containing protein YcgG